MSWLSRYKERFLTAGILLALVISIGIIDNFFLVWLFLGIIYMFAFYEALKLFDLKNQSIYAYALFLWVLALFYQNPDDLFFLIAILFGAFLAYKKSFDRRLFLPFLYPTSSMLFLLSLYKDFSMQALFWLLIIVVLTDVGAFFVGKSFGKTSFSERSPNKTLEGVIGGVLFATAGGCYYGLIFVDWPLALIISMLTAIGAIFGDLFESYLKREAGVKDSGDLLPGHGGILDRIDGYLFAAPLLLVLLRGLV